MKFFILQVFIIYIFPLLHGAPIEDNVEGNVGMYGDHYQGDIILTPEQEKILFEDISGRTGILNTVYRWPKIGSLVHVPYIIDPVYSPSQIRTIINGMDEIHESTCIRFVPLSTQSDYINIVNGSDCSSNIGMISGPQKVNLSITEGCINHRTVMHELIHALGYKHMHVHHKRDDYVEIIWNNIEDKNSKNFEITDESIFGNFGTPYDYESVMHYGEYAASKNGLPTIITKDPNYQKTIGTISKLSIGDIQRINNMYECWKTQLF